jgi:hypothetical protein
MQAQAVGGKTGSARQRKGKCPYPRRAGRRRRRNIGTRAQPKWVVRVQPATQARRARTRTCSARTRSQTRAGTIAHCLARSQASACPACTRTRSRVATTACCLARAQAAAPSTRTRTRTLAVTTVCSLVRAWAGAARRTRESAAAARLAAAGAGAAAAARSGAPPGGGAAQPAGLRGVRLARRAWRREYGPPARPDVGRMTKLCARVRVR